MIVVDTVVWVRHSQHPIRALSDYLETPEVLMHPMVLGELACGLFSHRDRRFRDWRAIPRVPQHDHDDVIDWIESERLMGRGIGFIDAHLLYSTLRRPGTKLWTSDKSLERLAVHFDVAHPNADH